MAHLKPPADVPAEAVPPAPAGIAAPTTYRQLFLDATREAVFDRPATSQ